MIRAWLLAGCAGLACQSDISAFTEPVELAGVVVPAEVLNSGARVYAMRCASCHGADGSGNGPAGRALPKPPRDFREANFHYKSTPGGDLPTDDDLASTIKQGRLAEGMPAWPTLSDEDLHAVIQYLKTLSPRWRREGRRP